MVKMGFAWANLMTVLDISTIERAFKQIYMNQWSIRMHASNLKKDEDPICSIQFLLFEKPQATHVQCTSNGKIETDDSLSCICCVATFCEKIGTKNFLYNKSMWPANHVYLFGNNSNESWLYEQNAKFQYFHVCVCVHILSSHLAKGNKCSN